MATSITWSPRAEQTFEAIIDDLIANWPERIVRKFVNDSFRIIDTIAAFPQSSPAFAQNPQVRRCVINQHVSLFYRVREREEVELITFWYNRRGLDSLKL